MNDTQLEHIAIDFGTPSYVYDLDQVTQQMDRLKDLLPAAQLCYAIKANPCQAVLSHIAHAGFGAEVITLGELERAIRAFSVDKIVLGGPAQHTPFMQRALELGVGLVSLDSLSQWQQWQQEARSPNFLVRINPGLDPDTHEHLATGAATSKFGMPLEQARLVAHELADRGKLAGFHVHVGSQIADTAIYDEMFQLLAPFYEAFPSAYAVDVGGGFAVPGFPLDAFANKVKAFASRFGLSLILEPGRYLVASAGVLLTRVLHVKEGPVKHLICDAGMADLLRPALYAAQHPIRVVGRGEASAGLERADVDGPLCENADRLAQGIELPRVSRGELLIVEQAGAYGLTMASNYASSLRPAEVVLQAGKPRLARRRERAEDLMRLECV